MIYFAGYKRAIDRYKVEEIERAGDVIVWCCDGAASAPDRPQDRAFVGNIVEALDAYGSGALGDAPILLGEVDRVIAIGSDGMMAAVARARQGTWRSISSPATRRSPPSTRRCSAMKEICASAPAGAARSGERRRARGVLLLQPGPGSRPRRPQPARPARPERRAGSSPGCGSTARCGSSDCGSRRRSSNRHLAARICAPSGLRHQRTFACAHSSTSRAMSRLFFSIITMAVAADALVLQPDVFGLDAGLVEVLGAVVVDLVGRRLPP